MENVSDRELFSELVDNPINPLHVHIVPPFVKENNPMFYLQINGEAAFKWRDSYGQPCKVFNLLRVYSNEGRNKSGLWSFKQRE